MHPNQFVFPPFAPLGLYVWEFLVLYTFRPSGALCLGVSCSIHLSPLWGLVLVGSTFAIHLSPLWGFRTVCEHAGEETSPLRECKSIRLVIILFRIIYRPFSFSISSGRFLPKFHEGFRCVVFQKMCYKELMQFSDECFVFFCKIVSCDWINC